MCVREHITQIPFGVVRTDGDLLVGFDEKPIYRQFVNAGVYVIDPSIIKYLPKDVPTVMPRLFEDIRAVDLMLWFAQFMSIG